ncbi:MAG TPA: metallophosphoesterase [Actinocrinis sp.]
MIRVAAVGDVHVAGDGAERLRAEFSDVAEHADVLLLAGDLTRLGTLEEAEAVAEGLIGIGVPTFAVLGNHDYHDDRPEEVAAILDAHGIRTLESQAAVVHVAGRRVGVAGTKGFGGGFSGHALDAFGEPEMKAFARRASACADGLSAALDALKADECEIRIALTHYAPVPDTVAGEAPEIYPFLGSYLLAQAIDAGGADIAIHGHAHSGSERGMTSGGVKVRNVAQPLIQRAYALFYVSEKHVRDEAEQPSARPAYARHMSE